MILLDDIILAFLPLRSQAPFDFKGKRQEGRFKSVVCVFLNRAFGNVVEGALCHNIHTAVLFPSQAGLNMSGVHTSH